MIKMKMANARNHEQIRRMKILQKAGVCYFCRNGLKIKVTTPKIIKEGKFWYITPNNFPYKGSVHHYLIVPKRHIKDLTEISKSEALELYAEMIVWLKKHLKVKGYSTFTRSGDMNFTGATLDHLHCHFLVGGKRPEDFTLDDAIPIVIAYKKR